MKLHTTRQKLQIQEKHKRLKDKGYMQPTLHGKASRRSQCNYPALNVQVPQA